MNSDGLVDLLMELLATLKVMWCKPATHSLAVTGDIRDGILKHRLSESNRAHFRRILNRKGGEPHARMTKCRRTKCKKTMKSKAAL